MSIGIKKYSAGKNKLQVSQTNEKFAPTGMSVLTFCMKKILTLLIHKSIKQTIGVNHV